MSHPIGWVALTDRYGGTIWVDVLAIVSLGTATDAEMGASFKLHAGTGWIDVREGVDLILDAILSAQRSSHTRAARLIS